MNETIDEGFRKKLVLFAWFAVCLLIDLVLFGKMLGIRSRMGSRIYMLLGIAIEMGAPFVLVRVWLTYKEQGWKKNAAVIIGIVTLVLILLRVLYEVRYDSFWTDLPDGKRVIMEVQLDGEYYSEYVFGSLAEHTEYLLVDGKRYENGDTIRLRVNESCNAQACFEVTTGKTSITAKATAQEKEIPLTDGRDSGAGAVLLKPDAALGTGLQTRSTAAGEYMKAKITVKLTRIPTFWGVIFH